MRARRSFFYQESSWSSSAIFPTVLFFSDAPNLLIEEPIEENPLFKSEKPFEKAYVPLPPFPLLLPPPPPPPPPPTERSPLVKAEEDLVKAESKTLPDLVVSSLAESNGFVTAVAKLRFERAGGGEGMGAESGREGEEEEGGRRKREEDRGRRIEGG